MINETLDTATDIMENKIFTNISAQNVGKSKPSTILPLLNIIAQQYKYNLDIRIDYLYAGRVLMNCVIFN